MAFGNNSFSEAAFASAGPTSVNLVGFGLTTNLNSVTTQGELGVDVPVTGFDLTVNNTTQIQDTLTAFAQAPFATESPSTFDPPNIDIGIVSNAAVTGIAMTASLGTAITIGDALTIPTGIAMTASLGTALGVGKTTADVTGIPMTAALGTALAFIDVVTEDVTGIAMSTSLGSVTTFANADVIPTGIAMTMNEGTATVTGDANVTSTGIAMTAALGTAVADANSLIDVTGQAMTMQEGTATAPDSLAILTGIQMTMAEGTIQNVVWNPVPTGSAPTDPPGWKKVA
tara:strand:+ start:21 stop:878 length:858 start_codon:yes stop_codon:yes gene_type:complete